MSSWLLVIITLISFFLLRSLFSKFIDRLGQDKNIVGKRLFYIKRIFTIFTSIIAFLIILSVVGINIDDFGVFLGTAVAVLGVSLFAQWSILSNVTASVVVFFFFPYRVGDNVKILDDKNSVEGVIQEISLFHVILKDEANNLVTFPNSMVFQKAVVIQRPEKKVGTKDDG